MGVAKEFTVVDLVPARAFELWTDLGRWPSFIDGFGHVDRVDDSWPADGSSLRWRSVPAGRGLVTEKVVALEPGRSFATQVFEERMTAIQAVRFEPEDGGALVEIELDYTLTRGGPLAGITDVLFIRRALTDALRRTLRRFAIEAAEEATL
jgi:uncharacterized membrane protein